MAEFVIQAEERTEFGKNANHRLRGKGLMPGVVYGNNFSNVHVAVNPADVVQILHSESGHNTIFKIKLGSKQIADVLIKNLQLDPLRGTLIHADFQTVTMDETMVFQVPVETKGDAAGVKNHGGVLEVVLREVEVECLPGDVPDNISVDVNHLEIGENLRVADLVVDSADVKVLSDPDQVVVNVVPPRVEEVEEVEEEEEEAVEPEVIGKGRPEEEAEGPEPVPEE
jgi:large subunit ribosomal protein L25